METNKRTIQSSDSNIGGTQDTPGSPSTKKQRAASASGTRCPSSKERLSEALDFSGSLPKLIVLDLDKTLWPFYCHEQTMGPYSKWEPEQNAVACRSLEGNNKIVRLFPDVLNILESIRQQGAISLAIASRSPIETAARGIMGSLGMLELFCCSEIHRGSKATHFENIKAATGIPYRDMLFFDDDKANVKVVSKLGVCCMKVDRETGLTLAAFRSGLKKYGQASLSRSRMKAWLTPSSSRLKSEDASKSSADH